MSTPAFLQKNSPMLKILICGFLGLLLMIPTAMIQNLVYEREGQRQLAVNEIASKWGSSTTLAGPILSIPYSVTENTLINEGTNLATTKSITKIRYLHILPDALNITTNIEPSIRNRGIYEIPVYSSKHALSGTFDLNNISALFEGKGPPDLEHTIVSISFTDAKWVDSIGKISLGSSELTFTPGLENRQVFPSGISAKVNLKSITGSLPFSTELSLRGSESIRFLPLGKTTNAKVTSPWPTPSFDGAFLPTERTVGPTGFEAQWKILDFNRDFPQSWVDATYSLGYLPTTTAYRGTDRSWGRNGYANLDKASYSTQTDGVVAPSINLWEYNFWVNLYQSVDGYDKTKRTIDYAILIIGLSFVAFFLMEVIHKRPIHPIQYLLVGFALVVFYTLLLSLSEHIPFDIAYIISAALTTCLITAYVALTFRLKILTYSILSLLSILYVFIYVILSSQDYALLLGSFGIFLTLAFLMYVTRNIDWYKIGDTQEQKIEE